MHHPISRNKFIIQQMEKEETKLEMKKWKVSVIDQETGASEWKIIHTPESKERLLMHAHIGAVEDVEAAKEEKKEAVKEKKVESKDSKK